MIGRSLATLAFALVLPAIAQAQALPDIIIHLSPSEAAAVQDAMDARARTVDATSAEFWQVERKLGGAIAANPDAQSEYAKIVTGSPRKGGRR